MSFFMEKYEEDERIFLLKKKKKIRLNNLFIQ